jgi:hypothetical protein
MKTVKRFAGTLALLAFGVGSFILSTPAQEPPDGSCVRSCAKAHADRVRSCKGDKACIDASVAALRECIGGCGVPAH